MREVLFRGKTFGTNKWVYGYFVNCADRYDPPGITYPEIIEVGADRQYVGEYSSFDVHEVNPETVGQWTGLHDKNGVKIFEGDIVKTEFDRLCTVEWFHSPSHCGWDLIAVCTQDNVLNTKAPSRNSIWYYGNLEVVGNTWDNPELFRDKEKCYERK